jgi:hypothetical protein
MGWLSNKVVRGGDIIALSGRRDFLVRDLLGRIAEVENVELLDVPVGSPPDAEGPAVTGTSRRPL